MTLNLNLDPGSHKIPEQGIFAATCIFIDALKKYVIKIFWSDEFAKEILAKYIVGYFKLSVKINEHILKGQLNNCIRRLIIKIVQRKTQLHTNIWSGWKKVRISFGSAAVASFSAELLHITLDIYCTHARIFS